MEESSNLPPREYYRLSHAARLLGCDVDDLVHLGACGWAELCACPPPSMLWGVYGSLSALDGEPVTIVMLPKSSVPDISAGRNLYDLSSPAFKGKPASDGPSIYAFLLGLFVIDQIQLRQLEVYGECLWSDELLGGVYPAGLSHEECWFHPAERTDDKLTYDALFITKKTFGKISGWLSNGGNLDRKTNKKGHPVIRHAPHPNTERFAATRERVLMAAVYCKTTWPEQCGTTFREWAALIDEKAQLFWPDKAVPPLSRDTIERLLGDAHKLPYDVE